jgi:tetratricopeptide (TPR) repeat protein
MKKIRSYLMLVLAAAIMSSCSGLKKMQKNADLIKYEVTPKVLETHANAVNVAITGTFPQNYFDKKSTIEVTPVLTYDGGETAFDKVTLQGEKVQSNNKMISYSGGNFSYSGKVDFKDAMRKSELVLRAKASRGAASVNFDPVKLADGVIATSTLVEKEPKAVFLADKFQRIIPESKIADIHYAINQAEIRSSELKGDDIKMIRDYINEVNSDPNLEFKKTVISSYASPDGEFDFNERLSGKRGATADKFVKKEFSKIEDAKNINFFEGLTTAEDWEGFKTEVEQSNIQDKNLILRVLSMYSDPAVREREIKNMSSAYEALKTDILPRLRRSKMIVNVDKIGRSDDQILSAMRSDPGALSVEEMLYSATLTNDLSQQLKFYQIAAQNFPKCIRAHNNIGYTYMKLGRPDDALAAFEKAKAIENNDIVKNNLAYVSLVKGDFAKAEELFTSMTAASAESRAGLGLIAITKGEYDKAVNYFGSEPSYGLALASLLKGDVNKAKSTLESLRSTSTTGNPSYLKAVVGARLDDKNYMLNNLRDAIGTNSAWKAYAKTDLEFAKYFNDDTFKSAVQ